jgi:hypothetical protein
VGILLILTLIGVAVFVVLSAIIMLTLQDRREKRKKLLDDADNEQW